MAHLTRPNPLARLVRRAMVFSCALGLLMLPGSVRAQGVDSALERSVKAAYLYKFPAYVDWPAGLFPDPQSPVTIGILGDDALASELAQVVVGHTSAGRPIVVQKLDPLDPAVSIQVVFIARSESARLRMLIHAYLGRPVLIVTESDGALDQGSMINLVLTNGHVRFEVSLPAVEPSGLVLGSGLLAVAQSVVTGKP